MKGNSGLELLPGGGRKGGVRGVGVAVAGPGPGQRSLLDAALGRGGPVRQEVRRPVLMMSQSQSQSQSQGESMTIMGVAKGTTWVRVENLAIGTSAEDVMVNHFPLLFSLQCHREADAIGIVCFRPCTHTASLWQLIF